jgi:hypothetical protein
MQHARARSSKTSFTSRDCIWATAIKRSHKISSLAAGCNFLTVFANVSGFGNRDNSASAARNEHFRRTKVVLAAVSVSSLLAFLAWQESFAEDRLGTDPRDDLMKSSGYERVVKMEGFIGPKRYTGAHARPIEGKGGKQQFGLFSDGFGRDLEKVRKDLRAKESVVIEVPEEFVMSSNAAKADETFGATFEKLMRENAVDSRIACQLFLVIQRRLRDRSAWKEYVDFLPRRMDLVPVFWSEKEMDVLRGTIMFEMVQTQKKRLREEYENVAKKAFDDSILPKLTDFASANYFQYSSSLLFSSIFKNSSTTRGLSFEEFLWAKAIFWTRALSIPNSSGSLEHGVEALVPLIDCANHSTKRANARYQLSADAKSVELRVISKVEEKLTSDDEIKISYGIENVERSFFTYGFVDEDLESILLPLVWESSSNSSSSISSSNLHKSCIELRQLPRILQLNIKHAQKGASAFEDDTECREALRILGMRGEQLARELRGILGVKESLLETPSEKLQHQQERRRKYAGATTIGLFRSFSNGSSNKVDADDVEVRDVRRLEQRGLKQAVQIALDKLNESEEKIKQNDTAVDEGDETSLRRIAEAKLYRAKVRKVLEAFLLASGKWKM